MIREQELIRDLLVACGEWDGSGSGKAYTFANRTALLLRRYLKDQEKRLMEEPKHPNHMSRRYMR